MELTKDIIERIYSIIEDSRTDGKIRKGVNEVTKSLERGEAKLSIVASDVSPGEIIQHLALLAKDKEIMHVEVPSKAELGAAAGLPVATAAVAIANPGEAQKKLKNLIEDIQTLMKSEEKPAEAKEETADKSVEPAKEKPAEKEAPAEKKEEAPKKAEPKEEAPVEKPAEETPVEESEAEETPAESSEAEEETPAEPESKEEVVDESEEKEAPVEEAEPEAEETPAEPESKEDKKEEAEDKTE